MKVKVESEKVGALERVGSVVVAPGLVPQGLLDPRSPDQRMNWNLLH